MLAPMGAGRYTRNVMSTPIHVPPDLHPLDLEPFRAYLRLLARMNMGDHLLGKVDPSDMVQQTFLDAHRQRGAFRGTDEAQLLAWLRQILAHNLADAGRALNRAKRDPAREQAIRADLDASSARFENWMIAEQSAPDKRLQSHERLAKLALALERLPADQRTAMTMRHCQGRTLAEIAKTLDCSPPTVTGLLQEGTDQMRTLLAELV